MDRDLVIKMLQYEDYYGKSEEGQDYFRTKLNLPNTTLNAIYALHRHVLDHFGFNTDDESVNNYRTIFQTYYNSPTDYDNDVISSVYYMKNNKCVFYQRPKPQIGDKLLNCTLLTLNGEEVMLSNIINNMNFDKLFIASFSSS